VGIWYIFPCFGILNEAKSGNPGLVTKCDRFLEQYEKDFSADQKSLNK
jgi:hypothetical protein